MPIRPFPPHINLIFSTEIIKMPATNSLPSSALLPPSDNTNEIPLQMTSSSIAATEAVNLTSNLPYLSIEKNSTSTRIVEMSFDSLHRSIENNSTVRSAVNPTFNNTMQENNPEVNNADDWFNSESNEVMLPDCVIKIENDYFSPIEKENIVDNVNVSDLTSANSSRVLTFSNSCQYYNSQVLDTIDNVVVENAFSLKDNNDYQICKYSCEEIDESDSDHPNKGYKCNICSKVFVLKAFLQNHLFRDHKSQKHQCCKCLRNFNSRSQCQAHFISTHKYASKLRCNYCSKFFKDKYILIEHNRSYHKITVPIWNEPNQKQSAKQLYNDPDLKYSVNIGSLKETTVNNGNVIKREETDSNWNNFLFCPLCRTKFRSKLNLMQHYSQDHRIHFRAVCVVCNKNYFYFGLLKIHYQHHCLRPFYCCDCKKLFETMSSFKLHKCKTSIENGAYSCVNCNKAVIGASELKKHICGKKLGSLQFNEFSKAVGPLVVIFKEVNLQDHIVKDVSSCSVKGGSKKSAITLTDNFKIYKCKLVYYRCNTCGKCFKLKHNLVAHSFCHSDEALTCPVCSEAHLDVISLQKHYLTHIIKPYKCDSCHQSYFLECNLTKHTLGIALNNSSFTCKDCDKVFDEQIQLETHECEDDELFTCEICQKCYDEEQVLILHSFLHRKEKPYVCPVCRKEFTCVYNLCHHYLHHELVERHVCEVCGKGFIQADNLQSHVSKVHNENLPRRSTRKKTFRSLFFPTIEDNYHGMRKQLHLREVKSVCHVCNKKFECDTDVQCHINQFHTRKILSCCDCRMSFISIDCYLSHKCDKNYKDVIRIIKPKKYVCGNCKGCFTFDNFKTHVKNCCILSCVGCRKSFTTILKFKKHACLKCALCKRIFKGKRGKDIFQSHQLRCKKLKCAICDACFFDKSALVEHTETHKTKNLNDEAEINKADSKEDLDLSQYYSAVTNPPRFVCHTCKKPYYNKEGFIKHCVTVHKTDVNDATVFDAECSGSSEVFSNTCEICHETFTCPDSFLKHACIKNKKKILKCDVCNLTFNRMQGYTSHIRSHMQRTAFICKICGKCMTLLSYIQMHIRRHLDLKKEKCSICNESFIGIHAVKLHMAYRHSDKSFECKLCDKKYYVKRDLSHHYCVVHPQASKNS